MSATVFAANPTVQFAKTKATTAFDQDNRQHDVDPFYSLIAVTPRIIGNPRLWDISTQLQISYMFLFRDRYSQHFLSQERLIAIKWGMDIGDSDQDAETTLSVENAIRRDPRTDFAVEWEQRSNRLRNNFNAYRVRIEMLKGAAEDERIVFNDTSEQDFWEFMRSIPYTLKADIIVTDSGNLRAVWRGDGVKHVGLQFLGGRWIEYVMWTRRTGSMNTSTKAGRDTFEGVKEQIRASSLASFLQ